MEAVLARDGPALADFDSLMVLVGRAGVGIGYLLEVVLLRQVKKRGHVLLVGGPGCP